MSCLSQTLVSHNKDKASDMETCYWLAASRHINDVAQWMYSRFSPEEDRLKMEKYYNATVVPYQHDDVVQLANYDLSRRKLVLIVEDNEFMTDSTCKFMLETCLSL